MRERATLSGVLIAVAIVAVVLSRGGSAETIGREAVEAQPLRTPSASPARPTGTPTAAPQPGSVDEIVNRWTAAVQGIRSWRGRQVFATLLPDGSREPGLAAGGPTLRMPRLLSTDEVVRPGSPAAPGSPGWFWLRFTAHWELGDEITLLDASGGYRYYTWRNERHVPLPPSTAGGTYWLDDVDDRSLIAALRPSRNCPILGPSALPGPNTPRPTIPPPLDHPYQLVGFRELDGRQVAELLVVMPPNSGCHAYGFDGNRVFLDLATYLPYRLVVDRTFPQLQRGAPIEITIEDLAVNVPLADADFAVALPPDVVTIYELGYAVSGPLPELPTYASIAEAAADVDFPVYWPRGAAASHVGSGLLERFGVRYRTITGSFQSYGALITITQGRYPPGYTPELLPDAGNLPPTMLVSTGAVTRTVEIGGHRAIVAERPGTNQSRLTLDTGETIVQSTGAFDAREAIAWAGDLEPVAPDPAAPATVPTPVSGPVYPSPPSPGHEYYLGDRTAQSPATVSLAPRRDNRTAVYLFLRDTLPPDGGPSTEEPPRRANLRRGTCADPAASQSDVIPLNDYTLGTGVTTVDLPIERLTDGSYVVEVHPGPGQPADRYLCGELSPANRFVPNPNPSPHPTGFYSQPPPPAPAAVPPAPVPMPASAPPPVPLGPISTALPIAATTPGPPPPSQPGATLTSTPTATPTPYG